jgi:hypothetical protein
MDRLSNPSREPIEKMGFAAIAITDNGRHLGLLYRLLENSQIYLLHLAWDHRLRRELLTPQHSDIFLWTPIRVVPQRAKQIAQKCDDIFDANQNGIPYSPGDPGGAFNAKHKFVSSDQMVGLTCASFVVSLLEDIGIRLIDRRFWQKHWDDAAFFGWILRALKGEIPNFPPATKSHCEKVADQIKKGAVRYKPTEIAGAATSPFMPVSFFEAFMLAGEISCELPKGRDPTPW